MVVLYYAIFKAPENEEVKRKLLDILKKISDRDETFIWGISKNGRFITILSESESQSHQRIYWIKKKADLPKEYRDKLVYRIFRVDKP